MDGSLRRCPGVSECGVELSSVLIEARCCSLEWDRMLRAIQDPGIAGFKNFTHRRQHAVHGLLQIKIEAPRRGRSPVVQSGSCDDEGSATVLWSGMGGKRVGTDYGVGAFQFRESPNQRKRARSSFARDGETDTGHGSCRG